MSDSAQQPLIDAADDSDGRSVDDVYDVLADELRRHVVATLAETNTPVDGATLAQSVASADARGTSADDRVRQVHAKLYHVHLPKLRDAGLVEYDSETDTVEAVADDLGALAS